jgi:predicted transcriptional regulator
MVALRADATDAELAVLKTLWATGASTIRDLADELYPGGSAAHYATVQKLLERLEAKGCVERQAVGRAHTFRATVDVDQLIEHRLRDTAAKLCDGSLTPLLTHLVRASRLSETELDELQRLIGDAEDPPSEPRP